MASTPPYGFERAGNPVPMPYQDIVRAAGEALLSAESTIMPILAYALYRDVFAMDAIQLYGFDPALDTTLATAAGRPGQLVEAPAPLSGATVIVTEPIKRVTVGVAKNLEVPHDTSVTLHHTYYTGRLVVNDGVEADRDIWLNNSSQILIAQARQTLGKLSRGSRAVGYVCRPTNGVLHPMHYYRSNYDPMALYQSLPMIPPDANDEQAMLALIRTVTPPPFDPDMLPPANR